MKIPAIRKAVDAYDLKALRQAEHALLEGDVLPIDIDGTDEGEQLTHILAAIWIRERIEQDTMEPKAALRAYTQRVRNSIS